MSANPTSRTPLFPLSGRTIALSISESLDLDDLGLRPLHLDLAMQELARYLLAQGAALAYGGDLRPGGFTEQLFQLVATYRNETEKGVERLHNYLAWPIYLGLDLSYRHGLKDIVTSHFVPPPPDEPGQPNPNPEVSPDNNALGRYWRSISLTAMRDKMHKDCQARILLGGKLVGYSGRCPGLLEEAWLALQAGTPLFVLGGFGGCAARVAQAFQGITPTEFDEEYQIKHIANSDITLGEILRSYPDESLGDLLKFYPGKSVDDLKKAYPNKILKGLLDAYPTESIKDLLETYPDKFLENMLKFFPDKSLDDLLKTYRSQQALGDTRAKVLDYPVILAEMKKIGPAGLNNGLSREENERLFATPYLPEMIHLVLKGLQQSNPVPRTTSLPETTPKTIPKIGLRERRPVRKPFQF